ncbi:probable tRNA pseudouridine synthase tag-124 isoform X4 [Glycine soja]|uniref:probable tRNA pseudouridine synthase tag-124 isoform X4 n=1 Tax=Glycine soja TaxID=3848 RepID=UPI00103BDDBC|nr:probable tRNA pseudouridine synthase tag-124 isoform X4 [Glycine soja]
MATQLSDAELIASLQARVKELEAENAKLLSQLADCRCHEMEKKLHIPDEKGRESKKGNRKSEEKIEKMPGFMVLLQRHKWNQLLSLNFLKLLRKLGYWLVIRRSHTIQDVVEQTKGFPLLDKYQEDNLSGRLLLKVWGLCWLYSIYCSVHAIELYIADTKMCGKLYIFIFPFHKTNLFFVEGEIDYVGVLNRVLPNDIRIMGWCPAPVDFHARFSCLSREYKYFFWKENLNIPAMEVAGNKLVGEHDFRNFCKMDAANVHNYRRCITLFEISSTDVRYNDNQLWVIKIRGSAFLWHQVRCMVAVLFMVGKGLESPNVIDMLLDTSRILRKPQYTMASEVPLVLQSCEFDNIKFMCSSDAGEALRVHLVNECQIYQLQAAILHEALLNCVPLSNDQSLLPFQGSKKKVSHVPLMSRPTEPSYEERRAKLNTIA